MRNLTMVFCLMFYCATIYAQGVVRDTLWKERFTNGIDNSIFPDFVSKYKATVLTNGGVSLTIPDSIYATYDPKYFYDAYNNFRTPIKVKKRYSGNVLYDSIRLEMAGVYFINDNDLGWEKDFTFSYALLDNYPNQIITEYTGKLSKMSNSRGYGITKVCVNCSTVDFNAESFAEANFYKYVSFEKIVSTYKNQSGIELRPSKTASTIPFANNVTEFTLPVQSNLDFSQPNTSILLQKYFCEQCAKDISGTNIDPFIYDNCMFSSQLITPFDYFIKFNFPGFNLIGYRHSTTTGLDEENSPKHKDVVYAYNLYGHTISDIDNYSGFVILVFSDGTTQKVIKNIK